MDERALGNGASRIDVSIRDQVLIAHDANERAVTYRISTASNGAGCRAGSHCTPTGRHRIRLKIGHGLPIGTVFQRRRPTGEVFDENLRRAFPGRDWILSRILWLDGLAAGTNRGGCVDTLRRFIYIHGTADEHLIGTPASHGCIRMRNADVIDLFDRVSNGAIVKIHA